MITLKDVKLDCRHFRGSVPCKPNKLYGVMCDDCNYYEKVNKKILIIKLGAAGDVIRTTPLLFPIKKEYPDSKIYWLTQSPKLVPAQTTPRADEILKYDLKNVSFLESVEFDWVINLDKDNEAISLADRIKAKRKSGYVMKDGYCYPADEKAEHKFLTGIFDNISKANTKNYIEEIFEICGYEFSGEKYLLDVDANADMDWHIESGKKVIGLNTGCGERWTSRLWKDEYWIELIKKFTKADFEVVLLGGPQEDEKNKKLANATKAKYFGYFDLPVFINLMNKCDAVISQVTMAMHIAIALGKKLILMNNIFNPNEFELYGNGSIIQPSKECICFFMPVCINKEYKCMDHLLPEDVFKLTVSQLSLQEAGA